MSAPTAPDVREVRERPAGGSFELLLHAEWEERFPGLRCGITAAAGEADFGISTARSVGAFLDRYRALAAQLGFESVAVPRQVHGARVLELQGRPSDGRGAGPAVIVPGEADGLLSVEAGLLLAVTAADCVPVYLAAPSEGVLALLHAGWRGVAAGVLEAGLAGLEARTGVKPGRLQLHLGPAICGSCYEVGPEVMSALGHARARARLDLRRDLAARAVRLGVRPDRITRSAWCTACSADRLHSHRGSGGVAGRMAAFLGSVATG